MELYYWVDEKTQKIKFIENGKYDLDLLPKESKLNKFFEGLDS